MAFADRKLAGAAALAGVALFALVLAAARPAAAPRNDSAAAPVPVRQAAGPIEPSRSVAVQEGLAGRAACPPDMALVEGMFCPLLAYSCIRKNDQPGAGCAEYARGNPCAAEADYRRYCIDRYEWPNRIGENPLVYVDWDEAKALCQSAGKRLCRRSEWILACEGPKRLPYPWGFRRQPSPCNIDRAAVLLFDVGALAKDSTREEELARLWQADRIGTHPDCVSSFGVYDLSGNVDEWTDDGADDPLTKNPATLNGGYWGPVRNTCRLTTKSHTRDFKFYQVGLRCCGDTIDGIVTPPPRPFIERDPKPKESGSE